MNEIDLSPLEKEFPDFRYDSLYFLRLANNYIESIFWHVIKRRSSKGQRINRSEMYERIEVLLGERTFNYPNIIKKAIEKSNGFDCFSEDFEKVLHVLPDKLKDDFIKIMEQEHGIFIEFKEFIIILKSFREKRNNLEHYNEKKRTNDKQFCNNLGIFLLPELLFMFSGRIAHYSKKLPNQMPVKHLKKDIDDIFRECSISRRVNTNKLFQFSRSKEHGNLHKSERKKLFDPNIPWRKEFRLISTNESDYKGNYKEHQFKIRYYFVGKKNLNQIKQILGDNNISFKRDIEPLYMLGMKIGLTLHRYTSQCINYEEERRNNYIKKKNWGSKKLKKKKKCIKKIMARRCKDIRIIRDPLAHNILFWNIYNKDKERCLSIDEVFYAVKISIIKRNFPHKKSILNDLYTQLSNILKKEQYALLTKTGEPSIAKIKKWTKFNQEEYKKSCYTVNHRRIMKKLIGKWKKNVDFCFKNGKIKLG